MLFFQEYLVTFVTVVTIISTCQAEYVPINCDSSTIGDDTCSGRPTYLVPTINDEDTYPITGFCIIQDDDIISQNTSYFANVPQCTTYTNFAGGMFFNYQDDNNYNFFFLISPASEDCLAGYVTDGRVFENSRFPCNPDTGYNGWLSFEVWADRDNVVLGVRKDEETEGVNTTYNNPYFPLTSNAGPLHLNDPSAHNFIHFDDFVVFTDSPATPEPEITTPIRDDNETSDVIPPQYQIRLQGDFTSSTGGNFSSSCAQSYTIEMDTKVQQMKFSINSVIGNSLCSALSPELLNVISASAQMNFIGSTGETWPSFYLELSSDLLLSEIEDCVNDITQFLLPHSNWGQYIVEPVPGCPEVDFTSNVFNDETDFWVCFNDFKDGNANKTISAIEPPLYAMGHTGYFSTDDGTDLTTECQNAYSASLYDSTTLMVNAINNPDGGGANHICGREGYLLTPTSAYVSAFGSEGLSFQDYFLEASGDIKFADVNACADKILNYLAPHSNWLQDPIIPEVPTCPLLLFSPDSFEERFQQWICVTGNKNQASDAQEKSFDKTSHLKKFAPGKFKKENEVQVKEEKVTNGLENEVQVKEEKVTNGLENGKTRVAKKLLKY